ncbi:MAG: type IV pilus secretin PilQ, partial [bacterium]|nr:type IV pilus secretin PilQ [bacterium]
NNLKAQPKNIEKKKKDTTKKRKRRNNKNKIILAKKNTNIKTAPPTRKPLKKKKRLAAPSMENSIYMEPSKTDPQPQELTKVSNTIPLKSKAEDFFKEEKSQVMDSSLQLPEDFHADQDESGGKQINYLRNTIETGKKEYSGEPMDFSFKNAELENVILFFAKVSGLSIVIDPGVTGKITAKMYQVPWDQALEYFLKVNGLDMILEGNLLRIGKVDVLAKEAQSRRKLRESRQMEGELEVITRTLSYTQGSKILPILKKQLSQRGEILEDSRTNTLIISEVPEKVNLLDKLIDTLDTANAQVTIEARIVETNSNYTESLGIQWGYGFSADAMYGNQTSLKFPNSVSVYGNQLQSQTSPFIGPLGGYAVNLPATGSNSGMAFSMANVANTFRLDMALSAMESKGKGRIISAPKTTTQNNMEATIMQGKQIPVQTIQNNTVTVQYRPAALELKVTPQITAKGTVICEIDIKNNSADFANLVNGIPPIITQTIKTSVMINDGGTIVIGGMYRVETSQSTAATPFFSKIPILGNLFKNSDRRKEQKELLIFITPRIIK